MSTIGGSRFGPKRLSAWQEMQTWRARRANAADSFQVRSEDTVLRLTNAFSGQSNGTVELAIRKASNRVQADIQARISKLNVTA